MNMNCFMSEYAHNYSMLYKMRSCDYKSYTDLFDEMESDKAKYADALTVLRKFCNKRMDFVTSDREAAAFVMTLKTFKII